MRRSADVDVARLHRLLVALAHQRLRREVKDQIRPGPGPDDRPTQRRLCTGSRSARGFVPR